MPAEQIPARALPPGSARVDTPEDMRELGQRIGSALQPGTVVVLTGPLGAGKTTLTQGIAAGLGVRGRVQSPTFTVVRTHKPAGPGRPGMLHMDAYRLLGAAAHGEAMSRADVLDAMESLDIDADLERNVLVAEWGRGVVECLAACVLDVEILRAEGGGAAEEQPGAGFDAPDSRVVRWSWADGGNGA